MPDKAAQTAIVLIDKTHLSVITDGRAPQFRNLEFPEDAVRDLEIHNKEKLVSLISAFLTEQKPPLGNILFLLSDAISFVKEFPVTEEQNDERNKEEILNFVHAVPFSYVGYRIYRTGKATMIVASNRELYGAVKQEFEKGGATTAAITPAALIGLTSASSLNEEQIKALFKRVDLIKQSSFPFEEKATQGTAPTSKTKVNLNKRLVIMIGALIILAIILIAMLASSFLSSKTAPTPQKPKAPEAAAIVPETIPPAQAPTASPSGQLRKEKIAILVLNASQVKGQAEKVKQDLISAGFTGSGVSTGNAESKEQRTTRAIYSAQVPTEIREEISTILKKTFQEVVMEVEASPSAYHVTITLSAPIRK